MDDDMFESDDEEWRRLYSSLEEQSTTQESRLDSRPHCPYCFQPLPHDPPPSNTSPTADLFPVGSNLPSSLNSVDANLQNIGDGQHRTNSSTLEPHIGVSGKDQFGTAQGQSSHVDWDPQTTVVQSSSAFDEYEASMPTPNSTDDYQNSTLEGQNCFRDSREALWIESRQAYNSQLLEPQKFHIDPALTTPSIQSFSEEPASSPNDQDWTSPSFPSQVYLSQDQVFDANSFNVGRRAQKETDIFQVGRIGRDKARVGPNGRILERHVDNRDDRGKKTREGKNNSPEPGSHRCDRCEAHFGEAAELRRHYRTHLHRYWCPLCSRGFAFKKYLGRHERTKHSTVRSFKCYVPHCQYAVKGFKRKDNLVRHVRTQHQDVR